MALCRIDIDPLLSAALNRMIILLWKLLLVTDDQLVDWAREELCLSTSSELEMLYDCPVTCLALESVEHRYLLSGTNNGDIYIHDLYNLSGTAAHVAPVIARLDRESSTAGHRATVANVSWYPLDTGLFLSAGFDRRLHVWDTNAMTRSETFKFDHKLVSHSMSPVATAHSLIAVCGEDPMVTLCDLRSGCSTHQLRGHAAASVDTCRWSPAHAHLLATGGRDKQILFWDVRYAKSQLASLSRGRHRRDLAHRAPVAGLRFLPDGRHLVSVARDGAAAVWDLLTGRPHWLTLPPLKVDNKTDLGYQPAVTDAGGRRPLAFLPCGAEVVSCDLSAAGPATLQRLDGHLRPVHACEYDPLGHRLLTAGADSHVLVWHRPRSRPQDDAEGVVRTKAEQDLCQDEWSDEEPS